MKRAWLNLRRTFPERCALYEDGLKRHGYAVEYGVCQDPRDGDLMLTWNRIHMGDEIARRFEQRGLPVIVTENASWGNSFAGDEWYTLARNYHNESERFPIGDASRWDCLGVDLEPWRSEGETVVLPSRGIGPAFNRMPHGWPRQQRGRVRVHPGTNRNVVPLRDDLKSCARIVTWGSGAAIKALLWGIKVESHMPRWIGEQDNTDAGRLAMFRRLAWAQWRLREIALGEPFARLLEGH